MSTAALDRFAVIARGTGYGSFGAAIAQMVMGHHVADIVLMTVSAFSFATAMHVGMTVSLRQAREIYAAVKQTLAPRQAR